MWAVAKPLILPTRAASAEIRTGAVDDPPKCSHGCLPRSKKQVQADRSRNKFVPYTSEKLKQWCERNKDRCFVPEWLLKRSANVR